LTVSFRQARMNRATCGTAIWRCYLRARSIPLPAFLRTRTGGLKMRHCRVILLCIVACLVLAPVILHRPGTSPGATNVTIQKFRPIDELFSIRRSQGWTLVSAPGDGRLYRVCGATQSDPASGLQRFRGAFSGGGRSVRFDVPIPEGAVIAVEGLEPADGGPLRYAVLSRPITEN
jgi:hypothetical protein